jgi:fluoroacetyl-CoA thioesterase
MTDLLPGLVGERRIVVSDKYSARHLGSGNVMVLATPAMIMLMEQTAMKSVDPLLPVDQNTVGVRVDVAHLGATPLGTTVRIRTELLEVEGRRLKFRVEAFDEVEKVGEGLHERFIIDLERFQQKLQEKLERIEE